MMDPQERMFLETAWIVMEDAGYTRKQLGEYILKERSSNVGVFVGVTTNTYLLLGADEWSRGNLVMPNSLPWSLANRVSYLFNFNGPSIPVDTACSSGLTAIHLACESIKKGECSTAIAGAVNLYLHPSKYVSLCQLRMLSPKGKCHSFGEEGDGFVPGEGVGAVFLKPLSAAVKDNDRIYGVIKGSSINHGGLTNGYTVPNPHAQGRLILDALKRSRIDARTISYIEAHGTGTSLGDPVEVSGLTKAFREYTDDKQYCSIGSVKSNIGHLEAAAGMAGISKILLQMKHKKLVPSLHSKHTNKNIDFENSPFYVQQELDDWKQPFVLENGMEKRYPRRAAVSSFGAGGANAHIIIEEYVHAHKRTAVKAVEPQIFVLSAKSEERLKAYARILADFLKKSFKEGEAETNAGLLDAIAFTMQTAREGMEERLAVITQDIHELIECLHAFSLGKAGDMANVFRGSVKEGKGKSNVLVEGEAGEAFINIIIRNREVSKLAQLWVYGVDIDWKLLHHGVFPERISLPAYPFARERYWLTDSGVEERKAAYKGLGKMLHPMIDSNESTFEEQCYKKELTREDFYIRDHIVNGDMILPGAAYIEMVRAAGNLAYRKSQIQIVKDVVWIRPFKLSAEDKEIHISLYPGSDYTEYEINIIGKDEDRILLSQGKLVYGEDGQAESSGEFIDLREVKSRCTQTMQGSRCYREFNNYGFNYGPCMQSIVELCHNETEVLAYLSLPDACANEFHSYALHPALMDGAFQAVIGLKDSLAGTGNVFLPYTIGEVEILGELTGKCFAYAKISDKRSHGSSDSSKLDIYITDETGQVLVRMRDFTAKELKSDPGQDNDLLEIFRRAERGEINEQELELLMGGNLL